jgi:hypothetical protein
MRAVSVLSLGLVVAVVLGALAPHAVAQPVVDKQGAKEAFAAGLEADKRKDYQAAIEAYLRAYELAPHPNALYNAAVDYERIGDYRNAATFYSRYLEEAGDNADDRPRVERLIEALRTRKSKVAIRTTPPGGMITIDGVRVGQAPVVREIPGGSHVIEAVIGERRAQQAVTVEYGDPAELTLALGEQLGTLSVSSNVSGAAVEIDGAAMGVTPVTVSVAAGDRKVIVRADGYATQERTVRVPAEGSAQINAILVRPVGFVEPTPPVRAYVLQVDAGRALKIDRTMVHAGFGYRLRNWEATFRLGFFGEGAYAYGLQVRRYFGDSKLKPYLGGYGEYGRASEMPDDGLGILGGHVGIAYEAITLPKMAIEITVEAGAALFAAEEKRLAIPILGSMQFRGR